MSDKILSIGTYKIHNELYPILAASWKRGYRHVDTAPNYRLGNAHLELRQCLDTAMAEGIISSPSEINISTKVGFISSAHKDYLIAEGIVNEEETYQSHNLSTKYVEYEMEKTVYTFRDLTLDTVFLHNPESQLHIKSRDAVLNLIKGGFKCLEAYVHQGKIKGYGIATWSAFEKENELGYFTVQDFLNVAEEIGGRHHHFRAIQLPINLVHLLPILEAGEKNGPLWEAPHNNLEVHVSSPLFGGEARKVISTELAKIIHPELSLAQAALLFARSHPSVSRLLTSPSTLSQLEETLFLENIEDLPLGRLLEVANLLREATEKET